MEARLRRLPGAGKLAPALLELLILTSAFSIAAPSARASAPCPYLPDSMPRHGVRLGMVMPLLTTAAYTSPYSHFAGMPRAFYDFYRKYAKTPAGYIVTNSSTDWLKVDVGSNRSGGGAYANNGGWGASLPLHKFLRSDAARACGIKGVQTVTDLSVADGSLFSGGSRRLDVLVVGHDEYVTTQGLAQLRSFVASGGRVVLMDGDNWEVQVNVYYEPSCVSAGCFMEPHMALVQGHDWTYNGVFANHSMVWNQFSSTDRKVAAALLQRHYLGQYCLNVTAAKNDPIGSALSSVYGSTVYHATHIHEASSLVNRTGTTIILSCNGDYPDVNAYVHRYRLGDVVSYLGTGSATIDQNVARSFLLASILTYQSKSIAVGLATPSTQGGMRGVAINFVNNQGTYLILGVTAVWSDSEGQAFTFTHAGDNLSLCEEGTMLLYYRAMTYSGAHTVEVIAWNVNAGTVLYNSTISVSV